MSPNLIALCPNNKIIIITKEGKMKNVYPGALAVTKLLKTNLRYS